MSEGRATKPPSLRALALITFGAAAVATALTVLVILPAEFGKDPTGFGRLTGLRDLSGGSFTLDSAAQFYDLPFRSDVIEIPFAPKGDVTGLSDLEYKVRMSTGETLIYSWEAVGAGAGEFYSDLHAETPGSNVQVVEFKQEVALKAHGSLVAPVDGVHGWYWQNKSTNKVVVRLKISGFYELIPPGAEGNKAGLLPVTEAAVTPSAQPTTLE